MAILLTKIKNNILLYGFILSLVVFSFGFGAISHAAEIIDQQFTGTLNTTVGIYAQTFVPSYNFISSITFWNNVNDFYICQGNPININAAGCGSNFQAFHGTSSAAHYTFSNPISVIPGNVYFFKVVNSQTFKLCLVPTNCTNYPLGHAWYGSSESAMAEHTDYDIYFIEYTFETLDPWISMITPESGHIPYKDFPNWQFLYNTDYGSPTSTVWSIYTWYGTSSSVPTYFDREDVFNDYHGILVPAVKHYPLANGHYYVYGELTKNGAVVATTSQIDFYINNISGDSNFLGGITWHDTSTNAIDISMICDDIDTDTILGMIECSFKRVIAWTFIPNGEAITDLQNSSDLIKTKFPFSTFFDLTTIVSNAIATTSTSTQESIGIPFIRKTATSTQYYIMPVITSTTMSNTIGSANASLWRTGIGYVIWVCTGAIILFMLL